VPPDDKPPDNEDRRVEEVVVAAAKAKLQSVMEALPSDALCVAADTLVVCENQILGKPQDKASALAMLAFISGKHQRVVTGLCVGHKEKGILCGWEDAECQMANLTEEEMERIIEAGRSIGVSGGYAIDEEGADPLCRIVRGELSTIIGLPLGMLAGFLKRLGVERCSQA